MTRAWRMRGGGIIEHTRCEADAASLLALRTARRLYGPVGVSTEPAGPGRWSVEARRRDGAVVGVFTVELVEVRA